MRTIRFAVATFGSMLLVGGLTACGNAGAAAPVAPVASGTRGPVSATGSQGGRTPVQAVQYAAGVADDAGSALVVMTAGGPGMPMITLRGATAWKIKPASDLNVSGGPDMPSRVILLNGIVYGRNSEATDTEPSGRHWIKLDPAAPGVSGASATEAEDGARTAAAWGQQLDPGADLRSLARVAAIEELGEEELGGTQAVHYRGTAGAGALLDAEGVLSAAQCTWLLKQLGTNSGSAATVDLWISTDGLLLKTVEQIETGAGARTVSTSYSHYGVEVNIQAPPLDDTADLPGPVLQPDTRS